MAGRVQGPHQVSPRAFRILVIALTIAACTPSAYVRRTDRLTLATLQDAMDRELGDRESTALYPAAEETPAPEAQLPEPREPVSEGRQEHEPSAERPEIPTEEEAAEDVPEAEGPSETDDPGEELPQDTAAAPQVEPGEAYEEVREEGVRYLTLREALSIAVQSSRDYLTRKEALYLQTLSFTQTRHDFTPQFRATLSYLFLDPRGGAYDQSASLNLSLSQVMPYGGSLSVNAATGFDDDDFGRPTFDSALSIGLVQPLLRGFGHEITYEPLVQAERSLVYEIRDFELFREDFAIDVANRYYNLVQQKQTIDNQKTNLDTFVFARRKADALFQVGRVNELDVLRARRSELNARNDLLAAVENYKLAVDRFRIFLGLPPDEKIDVESDEPDFVELDYDLDSAIKVALINRLDFITRRQQLEDVERGVRISRNNLLPDLDLRLDAGFSTAPARGVLGRDAQYDDYSASLDLNLPVDKFDERSQYRRDQIALQRARRSLEEFQDSLVVEIQSAFRELERRLRSLEIQRQQIIDQQKSVRIAELQFERGEIGNRDVVEANQSLLDARNRLINEQVRYEIARLQLLRNLGILFIDDNGMWK